MQLHLIKDILKRLSLRLRHQISEDLMIKVYGIQIYIFWELILN